MVAFQKNVAGIKRLEIFRVVMMFWEKIHHKLKMEVRINHANHMFWGRILSPFCWHVWSAAHFLQHLHGSENDLDEKQLIFYMLLTSMLVSGGETAGHSKSQ